MFDSLANRSFESDLLMNQLNRFTGLNDSLTNGTESVQVGLVINVVNVPTMVLMGGELGLGLGVNCTRRYGARISEW